MKLRVVSRSNSTFDSIYVVQRKYWFSWWDLRLKGYPYFLTSQEAIDALNEYRFRDRKETVVYETP